MTEYHCAKFQVQSSILPEFKKEGEHNDQDQHKIKKAQLGLNEGVSIKQTFSLKTTWLKVINESSLLKTDWSTIFVKNFKKSVYKKFIFGKIAVGKEQPATLVKKLLRR